MDQFHSASADQPRRALNLPQTVPNDDVGCKCFAMKSLANRVAKTAVFARNQHVFSILAASSLV
jgi:hypothetical protein